MLNDKEQQVYNMLVWTSKMRSYISSVCSNNNMHIDYSNRINLFLDNPYVYDFAYFKIQFDIKKVEIYKSNYHRDIMGDTLFVKEDRETNWDDFIEHSFESLKEFIGKVVSYDVNTEDNKLREKIINTKIKCKLNNVFSSLSVPVE